MKIIEKNILEIEKGIIVHQVNCQKVMGKGIAKLIRDKWPKVYTDYITICNNNKNDFNLLGQYFYSDVSLNLRVCSIFGQLYYGNDGKRYTDYAALIRAFQHMDNMIPVDNNLKHTIDIYFPERMSCINGGGDWNIVSKMIDYYFPNAIICKLPVKKI